MLTSFFIRLSRLQGKGSRSLYARQSRKEEEVVEGKGEDYSISSLVVLVRSLVVAPP